MKNLFIGVVIGCIFGVLAAGRTVNAGQSGGYVFVGTAGAKCGDLHDSSLRFPERAEQLKYWEQGFVDGALMANRQQSLESTNMVAARFDSSCSAGPLRDYQMREVGMQIIKEMKTAGWP